MTNDNPIRGGQKAICISLKVLFMLAVTLSSSALAQEPRSVMKNSLAAAPQLLTAAPANTVPQNVMTALSSLPEADTLLYINLHRISTEAAARVLPEKELAELHQNLAGIKKAAGIDPTSIDFLVLQVRFRKPDANLNFALPEFMAVASGDFSADALIQLAKDAAKGKLRDERYGSKTLWLMTIDEVAKEAEKTPLLKSLSEMAIVALEGNTIAVGTPGYLRAAIDAAGGKGRISTDLLNSVMRDPEALVSMAGSPWTAFAKTFALLGTENNPRAPRCDSKLGDFLFSDHDGRDLVQVSWRDERGQSRHGENHQEFAFEFAATGGKPEQGQECPGSIEQSGDYANGYGSAGAGRRFATSGA